MKSNQTKLIYYIWNDLTYLKNIYFDRLKTMLSMAHSFIIYIYIYIYKEDSELNSLLGLKYYKTYQPFLDVQNSYYYSNWFYQI